jgi:hypothetical protein
MMKRKITIAHRWFPDEKITYHWWRSDDKAINPAHIKALERKATGKIWKLVLSGNRSYGELRCNIQATDDPKNVVKYIGSWEKEKLGQRRF